MEIHERAYGATGCDIGAGGGGGIFCCCVSAVCECRGRSEGELRRIAGTSSGSWISSVWDALCFAGWESDGTHCGRREILVCVEKIAGGGDCGAGWGAGAICF